MASFGNRAVDDKLSDAKLTVQALKLNVNVDGRATDHTWRALFNRVLRGACLPYIFERLFVAADVDRLQTFGCNTEAPNINSKPLCLGIAFRSDYADS